LQTEAGDVGVRLELHHSASVFGRPADDKLA
jgi:hypothetical protein